MDEIKPVAWRINDSTFVKEGGGDWTWEASVVSLYDQQAIDTLRAEVERQKELISDLNSIISGIPAELRRASQAKQELSDFLIARAERAEAALNLLERVLGPTVPTSVTSSGARCEWEEALKILAKSKAERT